MSAAGIVAVVFLALMVLLVLRGIRGHSREGSPGPDWVSGSEEAGGGGD